MKNFERPLGLLSRNMNNLQHPPLMVNKTMKNFKPRDAISYKMPIDCARCAR